ncbi:hypothetical protein PybrP1_009976 [[Pythium] brassicae (nom. inval.)]|nr:hypothetical protein PybrP1_009976 [[Pythium] brassicae (nom. inval.)]
MPCTSGSASINNVDRVRIVTHLAAQTDPDGRLACGALVAAAAGSRRCGRHAARTEPARSNCGSSPAIDAGELKRAVESVPDQQRTTIRATAAAIGIAHSALQLYIERGKPLQAVISSVKLALMSALRLERLNFALALVGKSEHRGDKIVVPLAVTRSVYRDLLLEKVIHTVKAKIPGECCRFAQGDGLATRSVLLWL